MSFQADTAAKVTAAISAKPAEEGAPAPEMKLEDLEKHLDALKQMFIEKQKMMEQVGSNRPPEVYWRIIAQNPPWDFWPERTSKSVYVRTFSFLFS